MCIQESPGSFTECLSQSAAHQAPLRASSAGLQGTISANSNSICIVLTVPFSTVQYSNW